MQELKDMKEELKAALVMAYPGFDGLGIWEPARSIAENSYVFEDMNTDQIDVNDFL